ncbi:MAG: hypothetical protein M0C28_21215 [Candidatus Moduliflexus flocculans]|nr:hypothetical protein [Candidatus Moduliflexus flocculans]
MENHIGEYYSIMDLCRARSSGQATRRSGVPVSGPASAGAGYRCCAAPGPFVLRRDASR